MTQCLLFYTYCSSLGVNCYLYTDAKRTTTVSAGWVSDGTTNWVINSSGMITGAATCVFNHRAYLLQSNGYTGTITWRDCNNNHQYVHQTTSNWSYIIPCALEGSVSWNGNIQGAYMSIGFPCNCSNINTCENYTITASGSGLVRWVDCDGTSQSNYLTNGQTLTICARQGSVWNFATQDYVGNIIQKGVTGYTGGGTRGIVDNGGCLPYGTYMGQTCIDCHLYNVYADGNGGTYNTIEELNSPTCECGFTDYYCSCYGYDCDPYPNPCYYYSCSSCSPF
jgi:hypothetical protein